MSLRASIRGALCLLVIGLSHAPALGQSDEGMARLRLESTLRQSNDRLFGQQDGPSATAPIFGGNIGGRVKHASFSLLLPGWSQFRGGNNYRGAFFATAEAAIWTSFIVFKVQGNVREDSYQDHAQQFAAVQGGGRDDDYWRAVGSYRSNEEHNVDIRRDERVGLDPEGREYLGDDAWMWQSEARLDEYKRLRRDSISAYDNADLVLLFALINRFAAFVDAMRSGPAEPDDATLLSAKGFDLGLDLRGDLRDPLPTVALRKGF